MPNTTREYGLTLFAIQRPSSICNVQDVASGYSQGYSLLNKCSLVHEQIAGMLCNLNDCWLVAVKQGREPAWIAAYPIYTLWSTFWPLQVASDRKNAFSSIKSTYRSFYYSVVYFWVRASLRLEGVASRSAFLLCLNAQVNPDPSNHHRLLAEEKSSQSDASTKPKVEHGRRIVDRWLGAAKCGGKLADQGWHGTKSR